MEVLLVGGAIRDKILGREVKDHDYVVVGGDPKWFIDNGYEQVGNEFPVFLHPETKDEYALARKEIKVSEGYNGFEFDFSPTVSIEDDLFRRDLTINAIAEKEDGTLIDPYGGMKDIENKVIRHVSDHFKEDPVRVLRVARFLARYESIGFKIADETMDLMKEIVDMGEVDNLTAERVLLEMKKAFTEPTPSTFFRTLRECGALKRLLPEVDALFGVPQNEKYHPEVDTGIHVLMVIDQARKISGGDFDVMYAALTHDLGKGVTPKDILSNNNSHKMHEINGIPLVEDVNKRYKVPNSTKRLALFNCEHHLNTHQAFDLKARKVFDLMKKADAFRRPEMFEKFTQVCEADARGRLGLEDREYDQPKYLMHCLNYVRDNFDNKAIVNKVKDMVDKGDLPQNQTGLKIGEMVKTATIEMLSTARSLYPKYLEPVVLSNKEIIAKFPNVEIEKVLAMFNNTKINRNLDILKAVMKIADIKNPKLIECASKVAQVKGDKFVEQGLRHQEVGIAIYKEKSSIIQSYQSPDLKVVKKPKV